MRIEEELNLFGIKVFKKHPNCKGSYHPYDDFSDCGYNTTLTCDECKYSGLGGRKDPKAKCNKI